ncbi:acetyl-CoA carboxylase biotin carboxylase subunit [Virgibacillus sp. W0430]|uniref:acetyl-CoA carboxylase biotin carboxylase subunit n=1 Tax=Virgibacillus sp. W0430 TaxID=3391580 RepID=UPI003F488EBC
MIKKILIANRGAIASRIIRTCKRLNIKTVAVYSEADKHTPYVAMADECFLLGGPRVHESYLNIEKIIDIAQTAHVDAIHPGYGFLSENADFARKCESEGILFIGPNSDVIEKMGDKVAARKTMSNAGIPIIPGTKQAVETSEEAIAAAQTIGYPVMLKAAAGGGGIGMQVVDSDEALKKAFNSNSERAKNFFGNGAMFIEKKITNAHHVEVQLLADKYGNTIHLFERECSIQRRNQKVIEEAPSPFIQDSTRKKMGNVAVKAAKAINYTNAGTIEFLVDEKENFYFLEMNTRIQVEHGVTEEITHIDIVEEQINIANGKKLSFSQSDITIHGHAIEARIYAEDPVTFFPSPGEITAFHLPEAEHIRHEVTVANRMTVTPFYDPMIGKLIVTSETRQEAITNMLHALDNYVIKGIKTNIPMVKNIIEQEKFQSGITPTSFVEEYYIPKTKKLKEE